VLTLEKRRIKDDLLFAHLYARQSGSGRLGATGDGLEMEFCPSVCMEKIGWSANYMGRMLKNNLLCRWQPARRAKE
jgi:hypothetical protein